MKVLQVANGYYGSKLYREFFQRLRQREISLGVYVPMKKGFSIPSDEPKDVKTNCCFNQLDRLLFYSKQRKMICGIESQWDVSSFDLLHAHTVFSGGYSAWKLHKKFQLPYVVAVRDTDKNVFFRYMPHLRKVGVQILRDAAAVVFLSPAYQHSVIDLYIPKFLQDEIRRKSVVIPNGISDVFVLDRFLPHRLSHDSINLISVGALCKRKNIETTISAVEHLYNQGLPVTLTVVGELLENRYKEYLSSFPFVIYLGKQPPEKVKELMRQSDIFVMPSHTETFGLVYAEAMSQGLPVLYTRGQGFDGHFPDGMVGYAVDDLDSNDVAEKIKAVIARYDRMAQNAYEQSSRFSWNKIASQYQDLYQEIIMKKKRDLN